MELHHIHWGAGGQFNQQQTHSGEVGRLCWREESKDRGTEAGTLTAGVGVSGSGQGLGRADSLRCV